MLMTKKEIKFRGAIHSIKIDHEAEGTVIIKAPASDISAIKDLADYLEQELEVVIKKVS